ncbi:MAG TPA: AMP-binding protein [Bacteroidales bacterium]|jgi:long-chain acyl-CoA synthetase|nr:AMP-binding protein [Bacteroidales bacterium]
MIKERFVDYIGKSIKKNWNLPALSDYNGEKLTYADTGKYILKFHLLFEKLGIKKGDKIALVGKNSARWCCIYLAVTSYGAVIVPILPDFKPDDIQSIINHSDSVLLFSYDTFYQAADPAKLPAIRAIISLNNFEIYNAPDDIKKIFGNLDAGFEKKYPKGLNGEMFELPEISNEELAVVSYTSGTTGFSKGVMLQHNSLAANVKYAQENMPLVPGDPIVSFLPLAHSYGCAFEFLFPFSIGCHITILTKTPSPQIVTQAFQEVKPRLILSVPLVIEKIFKARILPVITKFPVNVMLKIPGLNKVIHKKIYNNLTQAFGGNFTEVVIGGAAFNIEAETFMKKIKFPFAVGYGMTECGPLISYAPWTVNKIGASGRKVDTLEVIVDSNDPAKIAGEILLRGENVMVGYYKNPEATREIIDEQGWMHTGDLGLIDRDGFIYIKGRSKSLILGSNGKNIYPEEIEAAINNKHYVSESLVVYRDEKLVALIYPDSEKLKADKVSDETLSEILDHYRKEVNSGLPKYMNISRFELHPEEFVKTPKRSIKRYLYN